MSFIQPATVKAIALSVDVTHLTDEAAKALAPDVEYRLREVIQDALKFAKHSKRTKLTTQDINNALRLRNIEPLYGFLNNNDPAKFVRATNHSDLYFVRDDTVPLEQITCAALPRAPNAPTVMPHWLFIDGVQPQTEENTAVERQPGGGQAAKRQRLMAGAAPGGAAGAAGGAAAAGAAGAGPEGAGARKKGAAGAVAGPAAAGAAATDGAEAGAGAGAGGQGPGGERVSLPVAHILSDEMQRLLGEIKQQLHAATGVPAEGPGGAPLWGSLAEAESGAGLPPGASTASGLVMTPMQRAVLTTMRTDPGMQQLLPYLVQWVGAEVAEGLRSVPRLHMVLRVVQSLLLNPAVALEPYLHLLLPHLLTCLLAKALGYGPSVDHWAVRDQAAVLVAQVCARFGEPFYSLQVKVSKQLLRALLDGSKPLTSHYGAVVGLEAMGPATVRLLLIPQLQPYVAALQPALYGTPRVREGVRQYEATRVYGALLRAAGSAMYDRLVTAAADGLPAQLFRSGGRLSQTAIRALLGEAPPGAGIAAATAAGPSAAAAAATSASPAASPPAPSFVGYVRVPLPLPDARHDAEWESLQKSHPKLRDMYDSIVANPASYGSAAQLINLGNLAGNPAHSFHLRAQAILHQLAKQEIGPPPTGTVLPPPPAPPPAPAPASPPAASPAASAAAQAGQTSPRHQGPKAATSNGGAAGAGAKRHSRAAPGEAGGRSECAILAESWREDADLGEVVWALEEVFGPAFLARLPAPPVLPALTI
ncbi:hypothetical protein HYH03_005572 [Edaphochlamys debaryana]|uniref:TATA box binding protein associated factor (TAF) histone-like fold domain-containing protein n=1 Tax=Edaphochlamys debaryana TaxID=47281 RepID=A0A835Y791_9CHLO|nr:hypothetical protein HYH03_005572 [Edaphochlamys debaryana]|eukprot:KAG2496342.1 hypothetical protein HYH03_005572 [Edaphochlamys debaryana]